MLTGTRLAVWGDPIAHSLSPALHTAAYRVLEVDWEYGRARVDEAAFPAALAALDASWRGLSLTMPL
jgi:shikimate dehydrogenase